MKIETTDFAALVEQALDSSEVAHMRSVIEKELLHYDILFCPDQAGLLDTLVFQGGTSLRPTPDPPCPCAITTISFPMATRTR